MGSKKKRRMDNPTVRDQLTTRRDASAAEIKAYLDRYACNNVDVSVNPIDLLRDASEIHTISAKEFEQLDYEIEQLKAGESGDKVKLEEQIAELTKLLDEANVLKAKLDKAPWLRDLLNKIS